MYELAMLGSIKKIRKRAEYIEALDKKYIPFAHKIRSLAHGFQEKAIVNLVEKISQIKYSNRLLIVNKHIL